MKLGQHVLTIEIPQDVHDWAKLKGIEFYAAQKADNFSNPVDTDWVHEVCGFDAVFRRLAEFAKAPVNQCELVLTTGIGKHVDNMYGLCACLTIHSDGFQFSQASTKNRICVPGDVMYFNDCLPHAMKKTKAGGIWIGLTCKVYD